MTARPLRPLRPLRPTVATTTRSATVGWLVTLALYAGCVDTGATTSPGARSSGGSGAAPASPTGGTGGRAGGDPASQSLASGVISPDRICAALAQAACEGAKRCCSTFTPTDAAIADCTSAQTARCQTQMMPLVSDPRSGYDAHAAATVVASFNASVATCDLRLVEFASARDGLLGMFAGTVASAGACPPADLNDGAAVVSCATPGICHIAGVGNARLTGTCGSLRPAADPCLLDTECDPARSLRCDFNSPVPGTISSRGEEALGLHGHCVARLADGAACARATECSSLVCENKHCVPRTPDRVYCLPAS